MKTKLKQMWFVAGGAILLWLGMASFGLTQRPGRTGSVILKSGPEKSAPLAEYVGEEAGAAGINGVAGEVTTVPVELDPESLSEPPSEPEPGSDEGAAAPVEPAPTPVSVSPEEDLPAPVASPAPVANPGETAPEVPVKAIPIHYGLYRYEPIWKQSPFMLETPLSTVVEDSFAKDLAVTSVSTIEGRTRVGYVNTKTRATNSATNQGPNDAGILVASVQSNPDPSKVVVEFSQGGKTAKVSYDPMTLEGKPTIPNPTVIPRVPTQPGENSPVRPPGSSPPTGGPGGNSERIEEAARRRIVLPRSVVPPGAPTKPVVHPQQQQTGVPLPFQQQQQ